MKVPDLWKDNLIPRVMLLCGFFSALPVLPFVAMNVFDRHTCIAAAETIGADTTISSEKLARLKGIRKGDLPDQPVEKADDIVGRQATKGLHADECISFSDVDEARVGLAVPATQIVNVYPVGSRVDVVVSPTGSERDSDGLVIERAIVLVSAADVVMLAVTKDERKAVAALIGRSRVLLTLAGEVDVP